MSLDEQLSWVCPWCKGKVFYFDRIIALLPDGTEIGMKDRCIGCGKATDHLPSEDDLEIENNGC